MRHSRRVRVTLRIAAVIATAGMITACGDDGDTRTDLGGGSNGDTTTTAVEPTTTLDPAAPGNGPGTDALDERSSVTTAGVGAVMFGMTVEQAEAAAGTPLVSTTTFSGGPGCEVLVPEAGPPGVFFTVTTGTVERVDIRAPSTIGTRSGARIGSTVAELDDYFGDRLSVGRDEARVFTPRDAGDAAFRVIFTTDGAVVTAYRSGRLPQIEPSSPC